MMYRNRENLLIFAIGAAAGAAVALLTAPKSGQETRQAIRRGADDLVTRGGKAMSAIGRRTEKVKDRVEGAVNDVREAVRRPGEAVKEAAHVAKAAHKREAQSGAE